MTFTFDSYKYPQTLRIFITFIGICLVILKFKYTLFNEDYLV